MGRIPKVEKERALLETRLQKRSHNPMGLEDDDDPGQSGSFSWSGSNRRQERLNSDSEQHCSGLKDMKPSDIPEAAPRPLPHATRSEPHAHGRFGCEDRQMPELIPKWKNGLDFKPSISLEPDYIDDSLSNHILPEHPPSFSSSDPPRYHDILRKDHLVNIDSSKGNAADLPGRFFPSQGPHSATHNFQPLISVKTEIDCPAFAPEPERETIRCENPFTHPSEIGCRTTSLNLPKLMLSDELPLNHDRRFAAPSWTNSMAAASANYNANTKAEAAPHNPFFNPTEKSAGLLGEEEDSRNSIESMSSPSMSRSGMSSTPVPCRSSYSPDIIKVLLDQVGGEKIKGIKHKIMNTVASRFGPEEYEATKQLLSSYTESADRGSKGHYACFPRDRYSENSLPFHPLSSDMSQLPGNKPAAGISPTFSAVMRGGAHQRASSNHRDVLPPLRWFGQANGAPLNGDDDVHLSDSLKHAPAFPLPHTETMDTDDTLDMCASDGFDSQMLSDRYDSVIDLRSSDTATRELLETDRTPGKMYGCRDENIVRTKASGSNSQNSGSEKDTTSPDPRGLDELSMSETSQTLMTSFEKHMFDLVAKYDDMREFVKKRNLLPSHPLTPEGKDVVYNLIITSIPDINKSIIGFCQDVPGFSSLAKGDKEILIKRGYYDIWIMTNSKLFHDNESFLQLTDGTFYTKAWMERILNPIIVEKIFSFSGRFNRLELNILELAILCAIQLTASGHESLEFERAESIQQVNSYFVDLLVEEVSKRRPANCSRILVDIFRLLPDLRELNMLQREIIASMSTETCPEKVDYKPESIPLTEIPDKDLAILHQS
ncbi:hypothetical protein Btru_075258 [Bulinus truncatus]|nr:hypothetical protein Btru_075258 [Bulinus truncatus]